MKLKQGNVVKILAGKRAGELGTVWGAQENGVTVGLDGGIRTSNACRVAFYAFDEVERVPTPCKCGAGSDPYESRECHPLCTA